MSEYPADWESDVILADGSLARVRAIRSDDAEELGRVFSRLSSEAIYYRFFRPKKKLTEKELYHFTHIDYDRRMALIVVSGGEGIAFAQYDPMPDEVDAAEVAFMVIDDQRGRGIATLLFEHLALYALQHGYKRFAAHVLPDNRAMLRVFRAAGFEMTTRWDDGVVAVDIPLKLTARALQAIEDRAQLSGARSVRRVLAPRSIAVIGASRDPDAVGNRVFRNLLLGDFQGPVYPVNPEADFVSGVQAYASILDIPRVIDLAVFALPAAQVIDMVHECAEKGVEGLVLLSAGFAEAGSEGVERQHELVSLARRNGMRLVGPNCFGMANTAPGVSMNATLHGQAPLQGRAGFMSQSGPLAMAILDQVAARGLGISTFVAVGNKADLSGNDLLEYWEDDDETDLVLLYLESFGNPRRFSRFARRVSAKKPVVAVKSSRWAGNVATRLETSAVMETAALTKTAVLAEADIAVDALFRQTGVIRVDTLSQLFDVAELLSKQPLPCGPRVCLIGNATGPLVLAADACRNEGLVVAEFSAEMQAALTTVTSPEAVVCNPVSVRGRFSAAQVGQVLATVLQAGEVDAVIVSYIPPLAGSVDDIEAAVFAAVTASSATIPVVANFFTGEDSAHFFGGEPGSDGAPLVEIPCYPSPEAAAQALAHAWQYAAWRARDPGETADFSDTDPMAARLLVREYLGRCPEGGLLNDTEAAALLSAYGISLLADVPSSADSPAEAVVTTMIGVAHDGVFGPLVMFGQGGDHPELYSDRAFRILPLTYTDARDLIDSVRFAPLLHGYQGSPPLCHTALADLLLRTGQLAEDLPALAALDLNPVTVYAQKVVVGGARIVLAPRDEVPRTGFRRLRDLSREPGTDRPSASS